MSKVIKSVADFLAENPVNDLQKEIIVSERLKDYPFTIRAMSSKELSRYNKESTKVDKEMNFSIDSDRLNNLIVFNHLINPDFRSDEEIKKAGCISPEDYLNKVLLAYEVIKIVSEIQKLSGYESEAEKVEEVKKP
jgi:hypothetical protein